MRAINLVCISGLLLLVAGLDAAILEEATDFVKRLTDSDATEHLANNTELAMDQNNLTTTNETELLANDTNLAINSENLTNSNESSVLLNDTIIDIDPAKNLTNSNETAFLPKDTILAMDPLKNLTNSHETDLSVNNTKNAVDQKNVSNSNDTELFKTKGTNLATDPENNSTNSNETELLANEENNITMEAKKRANELETLGNTLIELGERLAQINYTNIPKFSDNDTEYLNNMRYKAVEVNNKLKVDVIDKVVEMQKTPPVDVDIMGSVNVIPEQPISDEVKARATYGSKRSSENRGKRFLASDY